MPCTKNGTRYYGKMPLFVPIMGHALEKICHKRTENGTYFIKIFTRTQKTKRQIRELCTKSSRKFKAFYFIELLYFNIKIYCL